MASKTFGLVVAALCAGLLLVAGHGAQQRSTGVRRLTFTFELDRTAASACGWARTEEGEAEVAARVVRLVSKVLRAMEREASVRHEGLRFELALPSVQPRDAGLFRALLEGLGLCELLPVAAGPEVAPERAKLDAWRAAHPDGLLAAFNALDPDEGGPTTRLLWAETRFGDRPGEPLPLWLAAAPEDAFGAGSFEQIDSSQDAFGYPALAFELEDEREEDFARLTGAHLHQRLAILLQGCVRAAPTLETPLRSHGVIEGRFAEEELRTLVGALRERVGPLRNVALR